MGQGHSRSQHQVLNRRSQRFARCSSSVDAASRIDPRHAHVWRRYPAATGCQRVDLGPARLAHGFWEQPSSGERPQPDSNIGRDGHVASAEASRETYHRLLAAVSRATGSPFLHARSVPVQSAATSHSWRFAAHSAVGLRQARAVSVSPGTLLSWAWRSPAPGTRQLATGLNLLRAANGDRAIDVPAANLGHVARPFKLWSRLD